MIVIDNMKGWSMREGKSFIERAEGLMRRYPWIAITMGAGLGYAVSRRRRLS
jgi:hypothetical protein